jgi:predicted unusual protein kinase regulating ubiquinone biosynthesis (AarF/ABC1/UbiB family)
MSGFFSSGLRIFHSGAIFSTKLGSLAFDILTGNPALPSIAVKLREAFEELGATYIKLGQFIASAPSLFPIELVDEMQKCLDQVRPVPIRDIYKIIHKELGAPVGEIFHSFQDSPIASASIAQVHGAITKEGLDVVVKVQRSDIESILETDMGLIQAITWILEKIAPQFKSSGLMGMVEEFRKSILEETDFIREAANIEEFENYLLRTGEARAVVPRVYHSYSTKPWNDFMELQ